MKKLPMRKIIASEMVTLDGLFAGSIVTVFMNLGLIDEYHLFVNPVVLGRGKPLFKDLKDIHKLKLVRTKTFSNGVVLLQYQSDTKEVIKV